MKWRAISGKVLTGLQVFLGAWFLYSGGEKVFATGLGEFTRAVGNYQMVAEPWDATVAYAVPWLEIIAGTCLMLQILKPGALLVITGLVGMFSVAIGWAWAHNLKISCGCRGGHEPIHYWGKVAEFAGYLIILAWSFSVEWKRWKNAPAPRISDLPEGTAF